MDGKPLILVVDWIVAQNSARRNGETVGDDLSKWTGEKLGLRFGNPGEKVVVSHAIHKVIMEFLAYPLKSLLHTVW